MDNERIAFTARFNGVATNIELPIESVKAIYARENGQGLFFDETPSPDDPDGKSHLETKAEKSASDTAAQSADKPRSHLKVIK